MKIAILNDVKSPEARVAGTPDTVKGYIASGHTVTVVKGAGAKADFADSLYTDVGADIAASNAAAVKSADLVMSIAGGDE